MEQGEEIAMTDEFKPPTSEALAIAKADTITKWEGVYDLLHKAIVQANMNCAYCDIMGEDNCDSCPADIICLSPVHTSVANDILDAVQSVSALLHEIGELSNELL